VHGLICDPLAAFEPFFPEPMPGICTVHAPACAGPQEAHASHKMAVGVVGGLQRRALHSRGNVQQLGIRGLKSVVKKTVCIDEPWGRRRCLASGEGFAPHWRHFSLWRCCAVTLRAPVNCFFTGGRNAPSTSIRVRVEI
jgi:hypothetical protein